MSSRSVGWSLSQRNRMPARSIVEVRDSLAQVPAPEWDALAGDHPALRHAFLHALHETGCAAPETGWIPRYLILRRDGHIAGALPLYLKSHSYGEYVFDWAWADAYHRNGLDYYPKLLAAIPFSPLPGPRVLAHDAADRATLIEAALSLAKDERASSLHVLFPTDEQAQEMGTRGLLLRKGVQFHWTNEGYADFEAFLGAMSHDKRKRIRQERRKLVERGLSFQYLTGCEATEDDWTFFDVCYRRTHRLHHSPPYLHREFFARIARTMPENVLLMLGRIGGERVCSSLHLAGGGRLYGRYWGATQFVPGMHFEACYYQAIEYCIAHGIDGFEGGAQGEHKLARGLAPVTTWSAHWLAHPAFARAVEDFLARESRGVLAYVDELKERVPFKALDEK